MSISTQITVVATAEQIIVTAPGALRGPQGIPGPEGDVTPEVTQLVEDAQAAADEATTAKDGAQQSAALSEGFKNEAETAAETATAQLGPITEQAGIAVSAADRAESASSAAAAMTNPFPSTADGISATSGSGPANRFFSVPGSDANLFILYRNDAGVALEIGQAPNAKAIPKVGVEGYYNLVNPNATTVSGFGINSSSNYGALATSKSLAIRVNEGSDIVISNPAGNYSAAAGYGAAFFSDLPTTTNRVAIFNATVLTSASGVTYKADKVPVGAKYLVVNTEFQAVQNNWFAAYGAKFNGVQAFSPRVARVNDIPVYDRKVNDDLALAFSVVEGEDNLYTSDALMAGYIGQGGTLQTNTLWRFLRLPVKEGRTYAVYKGQATWAFPTAGSYGVAGANPAAWPDSKVDFVATTDPLVRTFTVPSGQSITHLFFNVYITPPGGDIDFTESLIIREGLSVPVRPLPYKANLAQVSGIPIKDDKARSAAASNKQDISQRAGVYNLLNPAFPLTSDLGINGTNKFSPLATAKSVAIPVKEGLPIIIATPRNNYSAFNGYGAVFYSTLPKTDNLTKVGVFSSAPTLVNSDGLTYRKDVVPVGAKYLVVNTEFQAIQHEWCVAYDTGFTAPEAYRETVTEISGIPITDRETQILAKEVSRMGAASRYKGKQVKYFGDSITSGLAGIFASYTSRVSEILQCVGTNYGSSGARSSRLVGIMTNLDPRDGTAKVHNPDYTDTAAVTIMIGTNDAGSTGNITGSLENIPTQRIQDLPFTTAGGTVVTTPDEYWALFPNTYYGNVSLCIEYVKWKNPLTVIYLISATQRPPGVGITTPPMEAVVIAMTAISRFYAVQYIDATHECGLDLKGIDTWSPDKLHPNDAIGVPRLGNYVGYKLLHS